MDLCGAGGFFDLRLRGVGLAEGDVGSHGVVGQRDVLEHDRHAREQPLETHIAHVLPVDRHASDVDVVEPGDQPGKGRLPSARRADEGGHRTGGRLERNAADDWILRVVAEDDVGQPHGSPARSGVCRGFAAPVVPAFRCVRALCLRVRAFGF